MAAMARVKVQGSDGTWLQQEASDVTAALKLGKMLKRRKLVQAVRIEHRNGGMWRPVKMLVGLLGLLLLGACATAGVTYPSSNGEPLYAAEAQADHAAGNRALTHYGRCCFTLSLVDDKSPLLRGGHAAALGQTVILSKGMYDPRLAAMRRAALGHELAHIILKHQRCPVQAVCEDQANELAPAVLVAGWGMTRDHSLSAVHAYIVLAVRIGKTGRGHESPCRELAAYEQAHQLKAAPGVCGRPA